jgi:AcrR family transcriptional regulator
MGRLRDAAKRQIILDTAFRVFGEYGFARTTVKRIAERAGIAQGSLYTYFRDKDELFRAAVEERWDSFLVRLEGIRTSDHPFPVKLRSLIDTGFLVMEENLPLLRGMLFEASQRKILHAKLEKLYESVEKLILGGIPHVGRIALGRGGQGRASAKNWREILRITINGILFSAASAEPESTGEDIGRLKEAIVTRLSALLLAERTVGNRRSRT